MPERPLPTEQEVRSWLRERRNWGRWGKDDQVGALNLVTPAKRAAAARLVRSGRSVSLSRPFPTAPGPNKCSSGSKDEQMGFQDLDKELLSAMRLVTEDPECRRIFQAVSTEGGKVSGWGLAKTLDLEPAEIESGFARLSDLKILDSSGSGMDGYYYLTPLGFKVHKYFESFSA